MNRTKIYTNILNAFENKFSWLGRQFAEEFLLSCASSNIQRFSKPEFRIRRHLMLFWGPAWLKTSLLTRGRKLLGSDLCVPMSDVSAAALRGTVESGQFVSPYTLKTPFAISTEFGQVISGPDSTELTQKLLCVLEEGDVSISLGKIAYLSKEQRTAAESRYNIKFVDSNTFMYHTDWVLMGATYNRKFMVDNAFETRFTIMYPEKRFDNELTKYITCSPPFEVDQDTTNAFREELEDKSSMETRIKLPDEVFESKRTITPRDCAALQSYILCRAWWGFKTSKTEILDRLDAILSRSDEVWKTADDKVFDCILSEAKPVSKIAKELDLTERQVYYSIKNLGRLATKVFDEHGNVMYKVS